MTWDNAVKAASLLGIRIRTMRKLMIALGLAAATLSLSACATVKGAGKDIQSVGQAGEDAIN